jgi:hypothetical protein
MIVEQNRTQILQIVQLLMTELNWMLKPMLTPYIRLVIICTARFKILKFCILPTECICVLRMAFGKNSDVYPLNSIHRSVFEA